MGTLDPALTRSELESWKTTTRCMVRAIQGEEEEEEDEELRACGFRLGGWFR